MARNGEVEKQRRGRGRPYTVDRSTRALALYVSCIASAGCIGSPARGQDGQPLAHASSHLPGLLHCRLSSYQCLQKPRPSYFQRIKGVYTLVVHNMLPDDGCSPFGRVRRCGVWDSGVWEDAGVSLEAGQASEDPCCSMTRRVSANEKVGRLSRHSGDRSGLFW